MTGYTRSGSRSGMKLEIRRARGDAKLVEKLIEFQNLLLSLFFLKNLNELRGRIFLIMIIFIKSNSHR